MSVVNCKVKYIRPKYNNLKEWTQDPNNVYIGRAGIVFIEGSRYPKQSSPFSNIYKVGKHGTREEVIQRYTKYIVDKLNNEPTLKHKLTKMKGKNLGCWCNPELCHGHILLKLIDKHTS